VTVELRRFVFTSTIGTIALSADGPATEDIPFNWGDQGGAYIQSRVQPEDLVLRYANERGLPGIALCISNTYGPLATNTARRTSHRRRDWPYALLHQGDWHGGGRHRG
jgi:nucleoside-diphosphate-sugar epimerase